MKPTEKQLNFFSRNDLQSPPTKGACTRMINFILRAKGNGPTGVEERIAYVREQQKRWIGQTIRYTGEVEGPPDPLGVVDYLDAKDMNTMVGLNTCITEETGKKFTSHPLSAHVTDGKFGTMTYGLGGIEIVDDEM